MDTNIEAAPWWPDLLAARDEGSLGELAERFGTTVVAIVLAFKRCGIAKAAQAPIASHPRLLRKAPKLTRSLSAWEVRFHRDDRPRVLLAADFVTALGLARSRGDVCAVTLLGPAL